MSILCNIDHDYNFLCFLHMKIKCSHYSQHQQGFPSFLCQKNIFISITDPKTITFSLLCSYRHPSCFTSVGGKFSINSRHSVLVSSILEPEVQILTRFSFAYIDEKT